MLLGHTSATYSQVIAPINAARARPPSKYLAWRLGILLSLACSTLAQDPALTVSQSDPPPWVIPRDWDRTVLAEENSNNEGVRYLLLDRQANPLAHESFAHFAKQLVNEQGVQDHGTLSIGFDPSYQQLVLHRVVLHRTDKVLDLLDLNALKLIQPEQDLAWNIYSGEQQATLFLPDLRVGDVLEYSFTLRGGNPVLAGHFWARFHVQHERPIDQQFYHLIWRTNTPLFLRYHRNNWQPSLRQSEDVIDYHWEIPPTPPLKQEDGLPFGYDPNPYIEVSNFNAWEQVVQWALPLYPDSAQPPPGELQDRVAQWKARYPTSEEQALAALQFVQDEVRYLGIEFGPNSHQPSPPDLTFNRRFGDCKDKAYLLCHLLKALNIQAAPTLVHTSLRGSIAELLPSPFAFNHVIVKLQLADDALWVDPTRSHQGGTLRTRFLPDYQLGLVLLPGISNLEPIPAPEQIRSIKAVQEVFTVHDYERPVEFTVHTDFLHQEADDMRAELADTDRERLLQDYLNYYAYYYPSITIRDPLEVRDDLQANRLRVTERYAVPDLWELDDQGLFWMASFYPDTLDEMLPEPATRLRKMPLRIPYPTRRTHEILIDLPEVFDVPTETAVIDHEAFHFQWQQSRTGKRVRFFYELDTLAGEVPPDQIATYLAKLDEVSGMMVDTLQRSNGAYSLSLADTNWTMVVLSLLNVALFLGASIWLCRNPRFKPDPAKPPPLIPNPQWVGRGGWLILVGFGLLLSPLGQLYDLTLNGTAFFSNTAWHNVAMPQGADYHVLYGPLLMFELVGNVTLLGFSGLLLYLFFANRQLFPRVFILAAVLNLAFLVSDEALAVQIPSLAGEDPETTRAIARATMGCLIWIPYMLVSKRVKATFVR